MLFFVPIKHLGQTDGVGKEGCYPFNLYRLITTPQKHNREKSPACFLIFGTIGFHYISLFLFFFLYVSCFTPLDFLLLR